MRLSRRLTTARCCCSFALAAGALMGATFGLATAAEAPSIPSTDMLLGARVKLNANWKGQRRPKQTVSILMLAGHADSQNMVGSGTSGAAVDLRGAQPMDPRMRDELFWNLKVRDAVVQQGRSRGLNISAYTPPTLTIANGDHPSTNWSVGKTHASRGGYALEIHFDAYGPDGYGSGLIPAIHQHPSTIDENLAVSFGRYPLLFREGLGAPKRGISILEIGKLEGRLETRLRDPNTRQATINAIARRITDAILNGIAPAPLAPKDLSSPPDGDGSARRETGRQTSFEDA
ncbi:MAG: N-acetylmuramoyl-L-alanine amidase [Synechococcus sp.]